MPRPALAAAAAILLSTLPALAADTMVAKTSPYSVTETLDRLEAAVTGAGATVFARIDHAAGAARIDSDLRPTQMLMFGNPKIGTPAMLDNQTAGLDLPLRVLAYADAQGQVHVVYHAPAALAASHGLPEDAPYLKKMTGALDKLTNKAVADN